MPPRATAKPCIFLVALVFGIATVTATSGQVTKPQSDQELAKKILEDDRLSDVLQRAKELLEGRFSAGSGYSSVWIRDLNTFIELALEVNSPDVVRKRLLTFFHFQGPDGNIPDGYSSRDKPHGGDREDRYRRSRTRPNLLAHKNTVETDQESSLIQAIYKYIKVTGDRSILDEEVKGITVKKRLRQAMQYVMEHRFSEEYGLLWGATTIDWGDVQPGHEWGVDIDENTHRAIDLYDNAMFLIAIENYLKMIEEPPQKEYWEDVRAGIANRTIKHLWDANRKKFRPNVYLNEDPWPEWFDESRIYYTGSPALAIRAGVLDEEKANQVVRNMINTKKYAGAATLGIVNFPPYPSGFFKNNSLRPYNYQNAGDWSWWGGRIIQVLVKSGREQLAYRELLPMLKRVQKHDGFYEWYTVDNEPRGSGKFRGSAGALGKAIRRLRSWAKTVRSKKGK